jgi:hypothetical protein
MNESSLKILEFPETLILEMRDLTEEEIEALLIQVVGKRSLGHTRIRVRTIA